MRSYFTSHCQHIMKKTVSKLKNGRAFKGWELVWNGIKVIDHLDRYGE